MPDEILWSGGKRRITEGLLTGALRVFPNCDVNVAPETFGGIGGGIVIEAIRALNARIAELEARLEAVENENEHEENVDELAGLLIERGLR